MTLRTRLLLTVAVLLGVSLLVSGAVVMGVMRANLVDGADRLLREARVADFVARGRPGRGGDPAGRRLALVVLNDNGDVLEFLPSGFARDPDPQPVLAPPGTAALPLGQIVDAVSVDGSLRYRAVVLQERGNVYFVIAAPLRQIDEATALLLRALVVVGLGVLGAALVVGWMLIRRDMRPLEEVTEAATRISAGELSHRAGISGGGSEVSRLGAAFDSMLDQIQHAFAAQQSALLAKERSEDQLRRFVADASHELRTPLTVLRGYADLYRAGGLADPTAVDQAMNRIATESRRMTDLVEDLLLLARLDQGRPLDRRRVPFSELVADAVADARAIEPERPIDARVAGDVIVLGDADRLRQVLGNLLANVRVHTPAGTPVDVSLSTRDGHCALAIADRGPGIPATDAGHIFDRFYRADPARSRGLGGSGLGLSIAARVVDAHGGSLSHSPTPGGGATFTVTLPLA
jgi:two-component system, OmpR family, sensor kinase